MCKVHIQHPFYSATVLDTAIGNHREKAEIMPHINLLLFMVVTKKKLCYNDTCSCVYAEDRALVLSIASFIGPNENNTSAFYHGSAFPSGSSRN